MKLFVCVLLGVCASVWGYPGGSTTPDPSAAPPAEPSVQPLDKPADEDTKRDKRQWYFDDFYPETFDEAIHVSVAEPVPVPVPVAVPVPYSAPGPVATPVHSHAPVNGQGLNPQYRTRNPGFENGAQFQNDGGVSFSELFNYQQQQQQQQREQLHQQQQRAQFEQQQQFPDLDTADDNQFDNGAAASTAPEFRSRRPFRGHISPYYYHQRPFGYGFNTFRNPYYF